MRRSARRATMVAWLLAFAGCPDELTELVVVVDTDYVVPGELDAVTLSVQGPSGTMRQQTVPLEGAGATPLPLVLYLEARGTLGPVTIKATGGLGGSPRVTRTVRTRFVEGESRLVHLWLLRTCEGVTCGAEQSCSNGTCVPVDVAPEALPPWTGSVPARDGGVPDAGPADAGPADAGPADAGPADAGPADACMPAGEVCNELDDDCDGDVDEDFDLDTDPTNCGACGVACPARANATVTCTDGSCGFTCDSGFEDCDGDAGNGCEAPFVTLYPDADGDGHGVSSMPVGPTCSPPEGYVPDDGDCDDTNDLVHPGADELCDGEDNDCDGSVDEGLSRCGYDCSTPFVVTGAASFLESTCGAGDGASCSFPGAEDHIYRLHVTTEGRWEFEVSPRFVVGYLGTTCGASASACRNDSWVGMLAPGDHYFVVEPVFGPCGEYGLQVRRD